MNQGYIKQVSLLLDVLPEVAKEDCFALHGGTAINLFIRNLPRLSVDIDLTYVHTLDRNEALTEISKALDRIQSRIEKLVARIKVEHKTDACKLQISKDGAIVKVEVNMVARGLISQPERLVLCNAAQEHFGTFCVVPVVPFEQLYGGKVCAGLDRQHPRDIFDVKFLLENEGFTAEVKTGFIYSLLGSNRPVHELLQPNLIDQKIAFEQQFKGMSQTCFTYDDYANTRGLLIKTINECLSETDKRFLLSFNLLEPDWSVYDFENFPSIKWKLKNLETLKQNNSDKYETQLNQLNDVLNY